MSNREDDIGPSIGRNEAAGHGRLNQQGKRAKLILICRMDALELLAGLSGRHRGKWPDPRRLELSGWTAVISGPNQEQRLGETPGPSFATREGIEDHRSLNTPAKGRRRAS